MDNRGLSLLALASRDLVVRLSVGATPEQVESGCRELLVKNTNGLGSVDTRIVDVASEIVRGVLTGVAILRSPAIAAATRGVCETGAAGDTGDAERLDISERICRDVRNSADASKGDYRSALEGAASAARMSADELEAHMDRSDPPRTSADRDPA
jgi:hypothetical protein